MELFLLEHKKLWRKRIVKICVLLCFIYIVIFGSILSFQWLESLFRIRRLTPLECFRLMGFSDADFWKAKEAGISNSQLYKQAGNSIVVDVLYYIFLELYKAMPYLFEDIRLSSFFSGIGAFEKALERLEEQVNQ